MYSDSADDRFLLLVFLQVAAVTDLVPIVTTLDSNCPI